MKVHFTLEEMKNLLDKARADERERCKTDNIVDAVIDELRNRKEFRFWWDDYDFQCDVIDSLINRIEAIKAE